MTLTFAESWWSKAVLLVTGVCICTYAISILWYVQSIPEIGLRCAFSPVVNNVDQRFVCPTEGLPPPELRECAIVKVGGQPVETWPQLLRTLLMLRDTPVEAEDLAVPRTELSHIR